MANEIQAAVRAVAFEFAEKLVEVTKQHLIEQLVATALAGDDSGRGQRRGQPPSGGRRRVVAGRPAGARKPMKVSAARRRTMRQQGKYLSVLRRLKPADRAKIQVIAKRGGVAAALTAARKVTSGAHSEE